MNTQIRSFLIEQARKKGRETIDYTTLCQQLHLRYDMSIPHDRVLLGDELELISSHEHDNDRPLLSCLVTRKNDWEQGDGFYKMCSEIRYDDCDQNWRKLKADQEFKINVINKTIEFWQNDEMYTKYR